MVKKSSSSNIITTKDIDIIKMCQLLVNNIKNRKIRNKLKNTFLDILYNKNYNEYTESIEDNQESIKNNDNNSGDNSINDNNDDNSIIDNDSNENNENNNDDNTYTTTTNTTNIYKPKAINTQNIIENLRNIIRTNIKLNNKLNVKENKKYKTNVNKSNEKEIENITNKEDEEYTKNKLKYYKAIQETYGKDDITLSIHIRKHNNNNLYVYLRKEPAIRPDEGISFICRYTDCPGKGVYYFKKKEWKNEEKHDSNIHNIYEHKGCNETKNKFMKLMNKMKNVKGIQEIISLNKKEGRIQFIKDIN